MNWPSFFSYDFLLNLGISIGIVLLFLVFRGLFSKYIFSLILRLSRKAPTDLISHFFLSFEKPIQWLFIIIGIYVASDYFPLFEQDNTLFKDIISSSVVAMLTWGLYNIASASSVLFIKIRDNYKLELDDILIPFLSKSLRVVIVAISFSIIAQEFGYDVNGFVAGLGLGGVAIAFAAKDAIGNLFGGFIIITEKPFTIGDWIMTPSVEGTVEDISFRSTKVRTFAQAVVTVPNATLANESITNWSQMGKRQISFNLTISRDTPKAKLVKIVHRIEDIVKNNPDIHPETVFVKFDSFKDNGYEVFLYFFTNTTVWGDFLTIKESINFSIMEILEQEEVLMGLESTRLYMDSELTSKEQKEKEKNEGQLSLSKDS
ncbi:mechanosensitive ion channel family protein [Cytobacillus purgationiresistens]|uniref:MscS family membrane protein n=1 Tax=Cytobacillus purgationiresistens TaxID=863449 RepID=A0ABU0AMZ4_9BACI|nr:mechanosensitive ion channel family protein [Cytobacillus purgationiresistens]MDQ0272636.1 MscS family membrane protein [Cytobacillus purgationiresistens]